MTRTFKRLTSFVSPGFGLTIACFNFPFSEKEYSKNGGEKTSKFII